MKILQFNQDWFQEELRFEGHEVISCGIREHLDIKINIPFLKLEEIIKLLPWDSAPDRIIFYDDSSPIMIDGLTESEIPLLFYSVDTHHHLRVHSYLGRVFDHVLVAQQDYMLQLQEAGIQCEWFPLWASRLSDPITEFEHDAVFVGSLVPNLNPERVHFFEELKKIAPIHVTSGSFWEIFPKSKLVVNQTVKGDLNFRVFEALASGAALLTEEAPNGLSELFQSGIHLETYQKNNVQEAANKIQELLGDDDRRTRIAKAGQAEVMQRHLGVHRAKRIVEILQGLKRQPQPNQHLGFLVNVSWAIRGLREIGEGYCGEAVSSALTHIRCALELEEEVDEFTALHIVFVCLYSDRVLRRQVGSELLNKVVERFPRIPVLAMANIWLLLNRGELHVAEQEASEMGIADHKAFFHEIDDLIGKVVLGGLGG